MQPITVSLCIFALLNKESNGQPVRNETRRETSCSVRNRLLQQTAITTESFLFLHGRSHHHKHLQIRMNQIKKENIRQGVLYYTLATVTLAAIFFSYIFNGRSMEMMKRAIPVPVIQSIDMALFVSGRYRMMFLAATILSGYTPLFHL